MQEEQINFGTFDSDHIPFRFPHQRASKDLLMGGGVRNAMRSLADLVARTPEITNNAASSC